MENEGRERRRRGVGWDEECGMGKKKQKGGMMRQR